MIKSCLVDARTPRETIDRLKAELAKTELYGIDCETQDEGRHEGLNAYNNLTRHVFDHRRTVMTGFSVYCKDSDTAYYLNLAHADVENRLDPAVAHEVLDAVNPRAIAVAHNAPFEIVMFEQCLGRQIDNLVCTLQMAVSHHGPDEYDLHTFYATPLPRAFHKIAAEILVIYAQFEGSTNGAQQELLGKFIAKESKAEHSYNGFVKSIAKGYALKALTKSRFGYEQKEFRALLDEFGAKHMGELTGEQTVAYGADDAYWAVQHYLWMFADSFVQEGVPSVFLMTGFANGGREKFTGFLSTHYHKVSDQLSLPIDWKAGAKFARINYEIAREIADTPEAPRWYADSFFGKVLAPGREKATR